MIVFFLVGATFSVFGLFMLLDAYFFRKKARLLKGSVIGYEKRRSKNGIHYYPVVQYSDDGGTYRFMSDIGSNVMSYAINEEVDVLVLRNIHSSVRLKRMARPVLASVFLLMGLAAAGIALSSLDEVTHRLYAANATLLLVTAAVYLLLHFSDSYRKRKEKAFSYEPDDGVIGYRTTDAFIDDAVSVNRHTVSKNAYLSGGIIGMVMIAGAIYWSFHLNTYIERAVRTHGSVVGMHNSSSDGSTVYAPVIEFTPYRNNTIRFTSKISSSDPSLDVGDEVYVFYDPDNVNDAMMDRGRFNYLLPSVLGLIGILIVTVSGWQFRSKKRKRRS